MDQHAKVSKNQLKRDNFTLEYSSSSPTFCRETITLCIYIYNLCHKKIAMTGHHEGYFPFQKQEDVAESNILNHH